MYTARPHRLFALLVGIVAWVGMAPSAHAHGGAFREDGGPLVPLSVPGGPSLLGQPPSTTGSGALLNVRRSRRSRVSYSPLAWRHWWVLHRDEMLPPAGASTRRDPITGSVEAPRAGTLDANDWENEKDLSQRIARSVVEPLLARMAQRDDLSPQELAAALIAWARCATRPPPLQHFAKRALARSQRMEVRESALLALGLLRRTDPRRRFSFEYVDRVRRFLEDVTADDDLPRSLRTFAALSLGLLGDQAFLPKMPADAHRTVRVLWEQVRDRETDVAIQHAATIAIGMQPCAAVPIDVQDLLQRIARGRNALQRRWSQTWRSQALAALARLDHPDWRTVAKLGLRSRRTPDILKYTCIALLGRAAPGMERYERQDVGKLMRNAAGARSTPRRVRGELLISLGRIFAAAAADPDSEIGELLKTRRALFQHLKQAKQRQRPFAAIALAMGVREMNTNELERHELAMEIRCRLVREAPIARGSDESVAAYALACGLARADEAAPWMIEQLDDQNTMPILRSHCALALGLLGRAYKPVRDSLRKAVLDRRAPGVHLYAVRALTMLGQKHMPAILSRNLAQVDALTAKRALVLGLARTGQAETFAPMLLLVADPALSPSTKAMAVAALGIMADPEARPSRTRLVPSVNRYLMSTEILNFLNVL